MNLEKYDTIVTEDVLSFSFISVGPKGHIQKLVIYQHVEELGTINDLITSDNKDTEKVLATVASTIFDFFAVHTGTIVLAQGSSHSRTRLYRRYLTTFFDFIDKEFLLYGELDDKIERFIKGKDYRAFLITKK